MKNKIPKAFWVVFSIVISGLGGLFIYFAVNCYEIAVSHTEPQLDAAFLQSLAGIILAIVFSCIKYFRKNLYWYLIPLIFVIFAVLDYFTIVGCPRCGALS